MPFISKDWRSPGEHWVKTDDGWEKKKILECLSTPPRRERGSSSSEEELTNTDAAGADSAPTWSCQDKEDMVASSLSANNTTDGGGLVPHCFIVIKSTKEIAGFNGLSDAVKRLDFRSAVQDQRRFSYITKLLDLLVSDRLATLSGCAQKALLDVLEELAYHVSQSGRQPEVLRKLLMELKCVMEESCWGRPVGSTALWETHLSTIHRIFSMADSLSLAQEEESVPSLMELPEECIREVMLRLTHHKDLESCQGASDLMARLCDETRLWRELTQFHFTQSQIDSHLTDQPPDWAALYHTLRKKYGLREDYVEMLHLCRICRCLFWAGSGHPCSSTLGGGDHHVPVPPHAFLKFFSL